MRAHLMFLLVVVGCSNPLFNPLPPPKPPPGGGASCAQLKPEGFDAQPLQDGSVLFTWTPSQAEMYLLKRRQVGAAEWQNIRAGLDGELATTDDATVDSETEYEYQLFGQFGSCAEVPSDVVTVLTVPAPVTGLTAKVNYVSGPGFSIQLSWENWNDANTGFRVERWLDTSAADPAWEDGIEPSTLEAIDFPVPEAQIWTYRVYARNDSGLSEAAEVTAETSIMPPTALSFSPASPPPALELSWTDNSTMETGYQISRAPAGTQVWTQLHTTNPGAISWTDDGTDWDTAYDYQVVALYMGGQSAPLVADGWTLPQAMTSLTAVLTSSCSEDGIRLDWVHPNDGQTGFAIERKEGAGGTYVAQSVSIDKDRRYWEDCSPLPRDTQVFYRVSVVNPGGLSATSEVGRWTAGNLVTDLRATPVDWTTVALSWTDTNDNELGYQVRRTATEIAVLPADSTGYADTGASGTHSYVVTAITQDGDMGTGEAVQGSVSTNPVVSLDFTRGALPANCAFSAPGTVTYDPIASPIYGSSIADVPFLAGGGTGGELGITGTVDPALIDAPGVFTLSWTVTDSVGGEGTGTVDMLLGLQRSAPPLVAPVLPTLTIDGAHSAGMQPWLISAESATGECTDTCSGPRASLAYATSHWCGVRGDGEIVCQGYNGSGQLGNGTTASSQNDLVAVCESGQAPCTAFRASTVQISDHRTAEPATCAVDLSGDVHCWGSPYFQGTTGSTNVLNPIAVGVSNAVSLAMGLDEACAVNTSGEVHCWANAAPAQVTLSSVTVAHAVYGGDGFFCALLADSSVECWGDNDEGELGNGTWSASPSGPSPVCASGTGGSCNPLTGVVSLSLGDQHACAVLYDGQVRCWGVGSNGEVGNGTSIRRNVNPVVVCEHLGTCTSPLTNVVAVSAAREHTCALLDTGRMKCWGRNWGGQLSDGTAFNSRYAPVYVCAAGSTTDDCNSGEYFPPTGQDVVALSSFGSETCMVTADAHGVGEVFCTGAPDPYHPELVGGPLGLRSCGGLVAADPP